MAFELEIVFWMASILICILFAFLGKFLQRFSGKKKSSSKASNPKTLIVFATETGTAEGFASDLALEFTQKSEYWLVNGQDPLLPDLFSKASILLLVVATAGEGEAPEESRQLTRLLNSLETSIDPSKSPPLEYAIFGLGDSSYARFNAFSKWCSQKLLEVANVASPILPLTLGDAYLDIQADFAAWKAKILVELKARGVSLKENSSSFSSVSLPMQKYSISVCKEEDLPSTKGKSLFPSAEAPLTAKIHSLECVGEMENIASYFKVVFQVKNIPNAFRLEAGDHLGLVVGNSCDSSREMLQKVGLSPLEDDCIVLRDKASGEVKFAGSALAFFTNWLDLHSCIPSVEALRELKSGGSCLQEEDSDKLVQLIKDWPSAVKKESLNCLQLLLQILSKTPIFPLELVLNLSVGKLQPRLYSIAEVQKNVATLERDQSTLENEQGTRDNEQGTLITCIFKEIAWETASGTLKSGLATGHLLSLPEEVKIFFKKSAFHLFKYPDRAIIMIANGAGIAPYIGFIKRRIELQKQAKSTLGKALMFYGCYSKECFPMKELFEEALEKGALTALHIAYSRGFSTFASNNETKKCYVQDLLLRHSQECFKLVREMHAIVYVCGNSHGMARGVKEAWKQIFILHGLSSTEANEFLMSKLYIEDVY